ncbi:XRE family transcriptional regulator, partial [Frankia sp. CiP1_Cm_nod2]|uniref:XRE family transcriptional regulator n=1 Tax=Frankia sp. CiP1_Cm_nod2 TaxID=2897161 RepID=UPI002023D8AE
AGLAPGRPAPAAGPAQRWAPQRLWAADGLAAALEEATSQAEPRVLPGLPGRPGIGGIGGAALTAAAHQWLVADPAQLPVAVLGGRQVRDTLVAEFEQRVDALRRMDDLLGGEDVHGLAAAELRVIVRLLRTGAYGQRQHGRLYAVAAELARLAGWAAFDSGRHQVAQWYWLIALRTAHEAGRPAIGANVLRCMAEQAVRFGDPSDAVTLLRTARAGAADVLTATERAIVAGCLAVAYAQLGDVRSVHAEIAEALAQIERADPAADPEYVYWCSRSVIEYYAGKALLCAGDVAAAVEYLSRSVDQLDATAYPRELIHHSAWLGVAKVDAGDVEQAVCLGYQVIELAARMASENARVDALTLCDAIEMAGYPGARALTDRARAALRAGNPAAAGP